MKNSKWFKGNTHVHTTLSGHADTTPDNVAKWYLDHGYNFLILSEHNKFIDPLTVHLPKIKRKDFILIPGQEVTGEQRNVHTTAMNIKGKVDWQVDSKHASISQEIQHHIDGTHRLGGAPILNHPNFRYAVTSDDILETDKLHMFELYNGHPTVNNYGDKDHISTEVIWDELLTHDMKIYGVSSDDAHQFKTISAEKSNPGRGWVMVKASKLTPAAITEAMLNGDFYSSNGVTLSSIERDTSTYSVVVDTLATASTLSSAILRGKFVKQAKEGYRIEFIGSEGAVLSSINSDKASYKVTSPLKYLRVRITFTRAVIGGYEEYYAWGQPVFFAG